MVRGAARLCLAASREARKSVGDDTGRTSVSHRNRSRDWIIESGKIEKGKTIRFCSAIMLRCARLDCMSGISCKLFEEDGTSSKRKQCILPQRNKTITVFPTSLATGA